jgi:rhodanese-related sulfurtransferase
MIKLILIALLFVLALSSTSCFTVRSTDYFTYQKLSPADYTKQLKDSSNYYLVDVRTRGEYRRSHLENAINFSYLKFHFGRDMNSFDRNKLVFVYCQTCHRSPLAARRLKHKGFRKVFDLKGGYQGLRVHSANRTL